MSLSHFDILALLLSLGVSTEGFCNAEDEGEAVEPETERKVNKLPYLDFKAREAKGEVVDRSVLTDAKYDDKQELISGKLMSIPADLDPAKYRLPGRKFWNDETDLLKLKVLGRKSEIAEIQEEVNQMEDTIKELSSIGDPTQRGQFAAARRAVASAKRFLEEAGLNITMEDLVARLNKAKSGSA